MEEIQKLRWAESTPYSFRPPSDMPRADAPSGLRSSGPRRPRSAGIQLDFVKPLLGAGDGARICTEFWEF